MGAGWQGPRSTLPPRLGAAHLTLLLEKAESLGLSSAELLHKSQVSLSLSDLKSGRVEAVPVREFTRIRQLCVNEIRKRLAPPDAKLLSREGYDLMCHALISSTTLREALERQVCFFCEICDGRYGRTSLLDEDGAARVILELGPVETAWKPFFTINTFMIYANFFDWLIGKRIPARFELVSEPTEEALKIAQVFGIEINFGGNDDAVMFPASFLDDAVVRQVHELAQLLHSYPFDAVMPIATETTLSSRVAAVYGEAVLNGRPLPALTAVARTMGMASATLRRRLDAEGQSLRSVRDRVRANLAREMLAANNRPADEIAAALGFSSARVMSRAFAKWTGLTVAAYRKQIASTRSMRDAPAKEGSSLCDAYVTN